MAMTLEEFRAEKARKAALKDVEREVTILTDAYPVEDFKTAIGAYEDMKEWVYGLAYELAFPDRKVIALVRGKALIEVYYEQRQTELER